MVKDFKKAIQRKLDDRKVENILRPHMLSLTNALIGDQNLGALNIGFEYLTSNFKLRKLTLVENLEPMTWKKVGQAIGASARDSENLVYYSDEKIKLELIARVADELVALKVSDTSQPIKISDGARFDPETYLQALETAIDANQFSLRMGLGSIQKPSSEHSCKHNKP